MKDLNKNEVYDLRGITEEQAVLIKEKLRESNVVWHNSDRCIDYLMTSEYLINNNGNWFHGSADNYPTTHISTLFEKSLEKELEEAETKVAELKKQIEERDKPKVGDVCKFYDSNENEFIIDVYCEYNSEESTYKHKAKNLDNHWSNIKKLTQQEVIDFLFNKK